MEEYSIVITGSTGFVGKQLIRLIRADANRYSVNALVRSRSRFSNLQNSNVLVGDLQDIPDRLFPNVPHVLIHFGTKNVDADGVGFWDVNVNGTDNILKHCNAYTRGIIYGSSLSVLGQYTQTNVSVNSCHKPDTQLAKSRSQAEKLIERYAQSNGLSAYFTRPRFIMGEGDRFFMPGLARLVEEGMYIGSGQQLFSIIDVEDYANIVLTLCKRILTNKDVEQTPLNIGYADPISFDQMFSVLRQGLNATTPIRNISVFKTTIKMLRYVPVEALSKKLTKLELLGFDHYGNVKDTELRVGKTVTGKPPELVFRNIMEKWIYKERNKT